MTEKVNPDDYIITRKRKKYRFAKFLNAKNCFEFDEWSPRKIDVIEIGAGTGLFSVELAQQNFDKDYLALDVKADRLQKGAYQALDLGLENIWFVRARADQVMELAKVHSVSQIWLTFPDPFPKNRSAGRRLTHANFLKKYGQILQRSGSLFLKHDNLDFFHWSLEQLVANKWQIEALSFDLHQSDLPEEYKILTTYEHRWIDEGANINFVSTTPPR